MACITAKLTHFRALNAQIRALGDQEIEVQEVIGQRYLGCGLSDKRLTIHGTPGNGLGQYLNGSTIEVFGNAQEAVGDTMNDGTIIVHGNVGDACGYAMRGGRIFVQGNCGYRCGIHMKAYADRFPVLVVGQTCGSFLGEYLAGGLIIVLGLGQNGAYPVNNFCGTGMHGGKIVIHCEQAPEGLAEQVSVRKAEPQDLAQIAPHLEAFSEFFGTDAEQLKSQTYYVLTPNPEAGYKQLYTYE